MPIYLLQHPHYSSDATDFLNDLKARRPELEAQQQAGRALLWDRPLDPDQQQAFSAARVPQRAYPYQTLPTLPPGDA